MSQHAEQTQLLQSLANRRGIPFRAELLPTQRNLTLSTGRRLSYLDWPANGPSLLLLHGGALSAHTWDLVCLDLARDFHCVAPDLPGHGDSDHAEHYSIEASVDDIAELLDALGWKRAHVAGMSLGGNVGFHFVARHPERAASLTMVDVGPEINFEATSGMRSFLKEASASDSLESVVDAVMAYRPDSDRELVLYRYMHLMRRLPDGTWTWKQDRRKAPDYVHILGKLAEMQGMAGDISCPTLVVRGARSRVFTEPAAIAFAKAFPRARWTNIPEAGHNIQEDSPKALAAAFREHLSAASA